MTGRLLALITTAAVAVFLAVAGIAAIGGAASACMLPPSSGSASGYDTEQLHNAAIIVQVGDKLPIRAAVIAVATAIQESNLYNSAEATDHDSVGLFQQRPSQGWGTVQQLLDPVYAAGKFYDKLVTVANWQTLPLTEAAQAVQRSAYPDAYAKHEADATAIVAAAASTGQPASGAPAVGPCGNGCPAATASPDDTGGCAGLDAVFARARTWLTGWPGGGPVPYLSSNAAGDLFGGYRRDCSGYVSMALGLPGPGIDTITLAARSTIISKADLQPGDLMINPDSDLRGHVVLFAGWTDSSMTSYFGYEQSGDGGTHYRRVPYPYFGTYPMTPYRFGR